jgi:catechol 2,3-dioxygenase-like lactoylglutathione lyase family enzyme
MGSRIGLIAYLVRDYDEAIAWFLDKLRFVVVEDTPLGEAKRWVVVAPPGGEGARLLLARAAGAQATRIGDQAGGRVFLFLYTDDIDRDRAAMEGKGVVFDEAIRLESYGRVCVFRDLYGQKWDLIELRQEQASSRRRPFV